MSATVIDAGRGQPNWTATPPRAAFFRLGELATDLADIGGPCGTLPPLAGCANTLTRLLADNADGAADELRTLIAAGIARYGFDPDEWVHELVRAILGAGYPAPTAMLPHVEQVVRGYLCDTTGADREIGFRLFGTEGGAAAMADVFRSLHENELIRRGDAIAIATPTFTPYLQIPGLEEFGFRIVPIDAGRRDDGPYAPGAFAPLLDPSVRALAIVNPGNPDGRAIGAAAAAEIAGIVRTCRPDLLVVADTVYASFVDGFRSILADIPRNVICLHSFSKNMGATGNRLGFVAIADDHVADDLLRAQPSDVVARLVRRYATVPRSGDHLSFFARIVADSREVALHNIAGLATPDQVQMALFALWSGLPSGLEFMQAVRTELADRHRALCGSMGTTMETTPSGHTHYYALVDLVDVARARYDEAFSSWVQDRALAGTVTRRLARDHDVIVLPGEIFGSTGDRLRVSLASLTMDECHAVGAAIADVVDDLHFTASRSVQTTCESHLPPTFHPLTIGAPS